MLVCRQSGITCVTAQLNTGTHNRTRVQVGVGPGAVAQIKIPSFLSTEGKRESCLTTLGTHHNNFNHNITTLHTPTNCVWNAVSDEDCLVVSMEDEEEAYEEKTVSLQRHLRLLRFKVHGPLLTLSLSLFVNWCFFFTECLTKSCALGT